MTALPNIAACIAAGWIKSAPITPAPEQKRKKAQHKWAKRKWKSLSQKKQQICNRAAYLRRKARLEAQGLTPTGKPKGERKLGPAALGMRQYMRNIRAKWYAMGLDSNGKERKRGAKAFSTTED